jgi:tetratricopeptide (TPR) repeat protein
MDNITEAMNLWDKILQVKKDYPDAFLGKALIYKSRGMYDNAIKELENILRIDVAFWRAYEPLIQCYHAKKDYKKSGELRDKLRKLYVSGAVPPIIIIDILILRKGFCIVKENIERIGVVLEDWTLYYFERYINKTDKEPKIFYEYNWKGILLRWEKPGINKDGSVMDTPKEIVLEKKMNYPELLKTILEREK